MMLKNCFYLDQSFRIRKADMLIEDGKITKIGSISGKGIECKGKLVTPGLCNAHVHSSSIAFRGVGEDMSLYDMFRNHLFAAEKEMTNKQMEEWAKKAMIEMHSLGITSIFNIDLFVEPIVKAMKATGMMGIAAAAIKDQAIDGSVINVSSEKQINETKRMLKKQKKGGAGTVGSAFGLANERECSPELVKNVAELAKENGTKLFMHIAESSKEHEFCMKKYGKSPVEWLDSLGVLQNMILIHGVHVNKKDAQLLAKNKCTVVHCPRSNVALGNGIANLKMLFDSGVNICIGTDHPMANPSLDLREEISYAWHLQKSQNYFIKHMTMMEFATSNASGMRIKEGAKADLVLWNVSGEINLRNLIHGNSRAEKIIVDQKENALLL